MSFGYDDPRAFDPLGVAGMGRGPMPASSSALGYTFPTQMPQGLSLRQPGMASDMAAADVPAANAPRRTGLRGMFGRGVGNDGGLSFGDKLGLIGDILTGDPSTQNRLHQQAQESYQRQQQAIAQQHYADEQTRLNRPQLFNTGDGQIVSVDPTTGALNEIQGARPQAPHVSEQQQLIDEWARRKAANPNDPTLPLLERAVRGYQYSEPVLQQRQNDNLALVNARGAQARATRATPTYGNLHPRQPAGTAPASSPAGGLSDAALLAALQGGH